MNLTLSPQLRMLAVVGLAALAVVMGGLYFMTRAQLASQKEATPMPVMHQAPQNATAPASASKQKAAANAAKASAKKAAAQQTVAMRLAAAHRLPMSIAKALGKHRVVVAALVVPKAELDTTVLAEAKAGAKKAGVGFVKVNVLKEKAGRALAERLGIVETPAVLVYRRPAKVFVKLEGFADQEMVRQAVANAFGR